ncbi:PAS domain-containing sensor histidine kinase [Uliginosibacterium sp. H3]|uniref:PAS domain-containing sensor histidine kinase n=1 Tax=Uliginosibacterium silvisoli TaxID=3114758 RepID=A0ABU6K0M1_9RHOO|nr:PAS domain-containing sensor histidine kinase [Uliginosibacterium sp. H3]
MFSDLHQLSHHHAWRRQLELLLESAGEGIYGIDLRGRCIFINQAGAQMIGFSPDEVLGRNMHYLMHHSHADSRLMPVHDCRIFRAFQQGEGVRVDDEVLWRRDGTAFDAEYASYPIREGDKVVGAVVTFNDISRRKQAERALEQTHQQAHIELERRVAQRTADLSAANEELRQSHVALQRLSSHLNSVREEERRSVARDIHDELGASLTALQLELNWLQRRLADEPALQPKLETMVEVTQTAMGAVRRILTDLRPGVLDHLGLWAALEWLLQDFQARSGVQCRYDCAAALERCRLGRDAEIAVYRIAQEVLTNVSRHAAAGSVELGVQSEGRDLLIAIRDDGRGMQVPAQANSFGLLGMQERARALDGVLHIDSTPGAGTTVTLRLHNVLTQQECAHDFTLPEQPVAQAAERPAK